MKITDEKKHQYWNHFVAEMFTDGSKYTGVTGPSLRKIKPIIWADDEFWSDIIHRHSGMKMTPEQLAKFDKALYSHCLGNFWGMICPLVEKGMMK